MSSPPKPALPKCSRLNVVGGFGGSDELLLIVRPSEADAVVPVESFTVIDASCVSAAVGVPLSIPVALIEKPLGRPLADHVYGDMPPVAVSVAA